jgi:hypothetical protein
MVSSQYPWQIDPKWLADWEKENPEPEVTFSYVLDGSRMRCSTGQMLEHMNWHNERYRAYKAAHPRHPNGATLDTGQEK